MLEKQLWRRGRGRFDWPSSDPLLRIGIQPPPRVIVTTLFQVVGLLCLLASLNYRDEGKTGWRWLVRERPCRRLDAPGGLMVKGLSVLGYL